MTEQKDILEKLNGIAIENWGTTERIKKAVAVIQEAWACIRDLRAENKVIEKQFYELVENTNNALKRQVKEICEMIDSIPTNEVNELNHLYLLKKNILEKYSVKFD